MDLYRSRIYGFGARSNMPLGRHRLLHLGVRAFCAPLQLEASKRQAAEAEANLRASTEKELREARQAAAEVQAKAERDLEETRQASAGGTRDLAERAKRREEVRPSWWIRGRVQRV